MTSVALFGPASARYKVYIIDEVHMLSTAAFNALLKTLEEPPEHVKFMLATTDPQRSRLTVLSRCQRFDLRRVEANMWINVCRASRKEGVEIEPEALGIIAQAAEGSVGKLALAARPGDRACGRQRARPRKCGRCWGWPTTAPGDRSL